METQSCPHCGKLILSLTKDCPWCAKPILPERPLSLTTIPQASPHVQPGPPSTFRHEGIYKVAVVVLLLSTVTFGGLFANYAFFHLGGVGVPGTSYTIVGADNRPTWSGFVSQSTRGSVSDVRGEIKIPRVVCPTANSIPYDGFWVGIDGRASDTVEQVGVIADCTGGSAGFYAFWEWYPARGYTTRGAVVRENDVVRLEVKFGDGQFIGTISDDTQNWSYSYTNSSIASIAERLSAEWIVEAPVTQAGIAPLANFDKVYFSQCYATINSRDGPMGSFSLIETSMLGQSTQTRAIPILPLSNDGTNFSVWWEGP